MAAGERQKHLNHALMRIPRRAESSDRHVLAGTYVAAGSFSAMLNSSDHQILYGRRGTGKTHALLHLAALAEHSGDVPVYLDLRTIGSAGGLSADGTQSVALRGTHLLVDTLEAVHDELLAAAVDGGTADRDGVLRALDDLAEVATTVEVVGEVERETTLGTVAESAGSLGLSVSAAPSATASAEHRRTVSAESRLRRTGVERHHVLFGPLGRALRELTRSLAPARLWLLLDEWSSVPLDLQPILADLLRRSVLPVGGVTVKIAAIERRSRFSVPGRRGDYVGIEVGADAASAVSLDDYLLFEHSRDRATEFFRQLFHNHAGSRLATMIRNPPPDAESLVAELFRRDAFPELVRAAEGVPRDAINIAALAAQHAHDQPIGLADVRRAARDWYLRDKQSVVSADEPMRRALRYLIDEVVGRRRSRTFLVDHLACAHRDVIDELFDARLLHLLRRGVVDPHHPGVLYDGFALDYGCYVSLLLDGGSHLRPRDRGGWLTSAKGVPPERFDFAAATIDLAVLDQPSEP
ncbi:hypothetical protein B0I33_102322 [Prauserella shujinwangii]|uniref:AAA ATPase-like protein n=1 Tax=Prauserella shujinwangii TaxID=1453103 RepID=A0A2T0M0S4_9PSEU|nr:hypothetical protein [Prauserella shujinwangii]PRX50203.1 hypothetical protein B0I33_102322 [Prauserella shujinwangii]